MDNALLFDDLERRNREAELLNEIAARTSSSLDMSHIADAAVAGLERLVPVFFRPGDGGRRVLASRAHA